LFVASAADACTLVLPNAPVIAVPPPAGAGSGPAEYSAAAMVPPPVSASVNVAVSVAGWPRRTGSGLHAALPATSTGPRVSPLGARERERAAHHGGGDSAGEPSSVMRTRSITFVEFGVGAPPSDAARSQMQPESAHTAVTAGAHEAPPSSE
jgi:hypothetical protein